MTPTEALARALSDAGIRSEPVYSDIDAAAITLTMFLSDLGYEVRPIEQRCAIRNRRYGPCTLAKGHGGLHQWSDIEQAAEERSSESGDPDTRGRASGFAPSSAAVAPLEPIPTDWGVGPLTRKRGGA